jgi:hypothetical protein
MNDSDQLRGCGHSCCNEDCICPPCLADVCAECWTGLPLEQRIEAGTLSALAGYEIYPNLATFIKRQTEIGPFQPMKKYTGGKRK